MLWRKTQLNLAGEGGAPGDTPRVLLRGFPAKVASATGRGIRGGSHGEGQASRVPGRGDSTHRRPGLGRRRPPTGGWDRASDATWVSVITYQTSYSLAGPQAHAGKVCFVVYALSTV